MSGAVSMPKTVSPSPSQHIKMKTLIILKRNIPKEPRFTNSQLVLIIDIFKDVGLLNLGSVALPIIFDRWSMVMFVSGLTFSFVSWYIAFKISGKIK